MNKYLLPIILGLCASYAQSACAYIVDGRAIKDPELMTYVRESIENCATLKLNQANELYLELEKGYIRKLISKVSLPGFKPLPEAEASDRTLAIATPINTILTSKLNLIPAIGKKLVFQPVKIYLLTEDDQEFYILMVSIKELKAPNNIFSIKIAVKQLSSFNELSNHS